MLRLLTNTVWPTYWNLIAFQRLAIVLMWTQFLVFQVGCDQSHPVNSSPKTLLPAQEQLVSTARSGEAMLHECISNYQSLSSYQDRATAELQYQMDGQSMVDRASMSVAWDQSGRIGLRVNSLEAGPSGSGRWHLRVNGNREDLEGQVLSRQLPDRVSFDWLLTDPVVSQELSVGLAGFPPQLDLLLSPKPLAGLMENASRVTLGSSIELDGRECATVVVEIGSLIYQLSIDQQSKLLRRIQLPVQKLPQALLDDSRISKLSLAIDFQDIQTNHSVLWSSFELASHPNDLRLTRLLPRPPSVSLQGYGKIVPAFQLRDPEGQVGFDSRPKSQRKASILLWLANHPSCQFAAEQLTRAMNSLREVGVKLEHLEFVSVWAEPKPPDGMTFQQLKTQWQLPGSLVRDNAAAGRDLFQVEEAPTLIVLDANGALQLRDVRTNPLLDMALPRLIQRIMEGEDLAQEIQEAQSASERRFQAEIAMFLAEDRLNQHPVLPDHYPPGLLQLTEVHRKEYPNKLRLLFQDPFQTPWILLADGTLNRLGPALDIQGTYQTSWQDKNDQTIRVLASPDGRLLAHVATVKNGSGPQEVDIYDIKTGQETHVGLPSQSKIVDIRWLAATPIDNNSATLPITKRSNSMARMEYPSTLQRQGLGQRLAILTASNQVVLYDWETKERYSGTCPAQPTSLIDYCGSVVLKDGSIEPIALLDRNNNSRHAPQAASDGVATRRYGKLAFQPLTGPWGTACTQSNWHSIAAGLLAKSEPAMFLLDAQLQPIGHQRLPTTALQSSELYRIVHAQSPGNGAVFWAILEPSSVVHIIPVDGTWADHFRLGESLNGIALIAAGDRLNLLVAEADQIIAYQLN